MSAGRVNARRLWVAVCCNVLNRGKWCCSSVILEIGSKGQNCCMFFEKGVKMLFCCTGNFSRRVLSASVEFLSIMLGSGYSGSLGACSGWVLIFDSGYLGASGSFTQWMNDLLWGILGSSNPYLWMCCEMCLHPNGGSGCSWSLSL